LKKTKPGVKRNDPSTWTQWGVDIRGIIVDGATIQSAAAWSIRGLPTVKNIFTKIWGTESLLVSMDSTILWKPWWGEHKSRLPSTEGLHMDQNPWAKPGKECFQAMLPLLDVTKEIGGLQVVPKSHLYENKEIWKQKNSVMKGCGDFCRVTKNDPWQTQTKLLLATAGDLIIWDSRTVHGGLVGPGPTDINAEVTQLARLSQTVCMTPRSKANDYVLNERKQGFEEGMGFSHWPHEINITAHSRPGYKPIDLTKEQRNLL